MRWKLVCVGKLRASPLVAIADDYERRIQRYLPFQVQEVREGHGRRPDEVRRAEAKHVLAAAGAARLVLLDERGECPDSLAFARRMERAYEDRLDLCFAIGGAHGHDASLREVAWWTWSLSPLTFPHDLARIVATEQLYRAMTVRAGEPYHKP